VAAALSSALWLAAARGLAVGLERLDVFPGLGARLLQVAPLLLGLGVALFLLTSALNYLLMAVGASQLALRRALQFEIASREAELRALRAQIHPHFLFNSLNSINALIAAKPEDARRLCVRLGDFLRRSLTLGAREAIPLAEELDLAEQLLAIEKVRFGERLSHQVVADDEARACLVPPLVLQPLVENAVTHGIAQRLEGGLVRIEAERRGAELRITISNPRDIDAAPRRGAGIGLENVKRRLAALHGEEAELSVVPSDEAYRVELRLPVKH
jgi:LytS/YehU family sensor histidine kinase